MSHDYPPCTGEDCQGARVGRYPGNGSPWADFLHHRARAFRWLRDEMGKGPAEIAESMSCDPGQVRLVLMTVDQHPEEYEP